MAVVAGSNVTSLPPVVTDPEGPCPARERVLSPTGWWPHDWRTVSAGPGVNGEPAYSYRLCRYCGGRKS